MAIYHFSAKVISRANGSSAVASAAYRSADRLHDDRLDRDHDFTNKSGVVHSEVMLPDGAPARMGDRSALWNEVEATELRKDAQLAREIEFAIPRELNQQQGIELAREFVQADFVERGMIADVNVHWDIGADGLAKPHAHVMLTMREVSEGGFGAKVRNWNKTELLEQWRERWASHVNERLAALDIDASIDHRSFKEQGIDLAPQNKIGPAASRMVSDGLELERIADHAEIARHNGERIIANPNIALDAITRQQATFTKRDLAMFVHRHSEGKEQFDRAMIGVQTSPDLVALGKDGRGEDRFTSRDMIEVEARLERASQAMAERERHRVGEHEKGRAMAAAEARGLALSGEQRAAFDHVTGGKDLGVVIGYAGTGKSAMLSVAREAWEAAGYQVRGAALSGIAAEGLEAGSAIPSRTIASLEHQWAQGRELLTSRDVLVIDEAGMIGSRQMERLVSAANEAGAKLVLVGDPQQLQAIEAGAAFRSIAERQGGVEITQIRRQNQDWQRDATRQLATGRTGDALRDYAERGMVHSADTRAAARGASIETWDADRIAAPNDSRIILTHTNDEVRELNMAARDRLRANGELGSDIAVQVERGERSFASGDRVMFLRNDRELGVKNGTLGTLQSVSRQGMAVALDDGRRVAFDMKDYAHIDHGYAATIHKSQGVTVDRAYVLATPGMDQHSSYVALSRHRESVSLHYGRDDFADAGKLARSLSRERTKDMALDYARERDVDPARAFAERRGISFRERVTEIVRKIVPEKAKSIFASFRPALEPQHALVIEQKPKAGTLDIGRGVERYARAVADLERAVARGLEPMPHQLAAREKAFAGLNDIRPEAGSDLSAAFRSQPELVGQAASGRTANAIRAMQLEAEIRTNPAMRADRFVENWQRLHRQRDQAFQTGNYRRADAVSASMGAMAKSLERDPQVDSLLRNRKIELGLRASGSGGIAHQLHEAFGLGRGRGLGIGM
ncbi:MAG: Ti-type conjugative transfer relaxase TraA [Sphingopyxis sp.]|nr:Ti-type conjugative transfer relaxase TraA [Sphingopyxis sp.]